MTAFNALDKMTMDGQISPQYFFISFDFGFLCAWGDSIRLLYRKRQ
jgi:hypothetical protein